MTVLIICNCHPPATCHSLKSVAVAADRCDGVYGRTIGRSWQKWQIETYQKFTNGRSVTEERLI